MSRTIGTKDAVCEVGALVSIALHASLGKCLTLVKIIEKATVVADKSGHILDVSVCKTCGTCN